MLDRNDVPTSFSLGVVARVSNTHWPRPAIKTIQVIPTLRGELKEGRAHVSTDYPDGFA